MKRSNYRLPTRKAFTLVELLVVITIVIALAALTFSTVTRMRKRADGVKQTSIMRQIGPLMVLHSTDNGGMLPAGVSKPGSVHWHQTLHALMSPELPISKVTSFEYWKNNKPLIKNPLYKKPIGNGGATLDPMNPWVPGYGMNTAIVDNLKLLDWGNNPNNEWQANKRIPLAAIGDTARTPLIAPAPDYHYGTIKDKDPNLEQFLINKQIPVLFVDGHIENMAPKEYEARKLHQMPR